MNRISDERLANFVKSFPGDKIAGDLVDARQRIAALQADNDRLRAALQTVWPLYKNDCNCRKCETARAALSPPKSPEGVTERPVPEPPLPPPNISATTGKPWKKAWEKTFEAPAPVGLTLAEQVEGLRLLRDLYDKCPMTVPIVRDFLSRPTVAAILQGGAR